MEYDKTDKSGKEPVDQRRTIRSEDIFQGDREVIIQHGDGSYHLLITRAGKLILNK